MRCGMLITSPLRCLCMQSTEAWNDARSPLHHACAYSDDFISSSDMRLIRCIDVHVSCTKGSDALHFGNGLEKRTFGLQRHASSMLAFPCVVALCVVVRGATQSLKRERWSNKLDQRRCFYNDCCCIDSSRSSGALSITLRRWRGNGGNVAIVARPRTSAGCIIVHAIVIVRPHPHDFYVQIPDPAEGGRRPTG